MKIPLIIPIFNQLTYTKNLINWWRWYHSDPIKYPIYIVDNGSDYKPLLDWETLVTTPTIHKCSENNFIPNLTNFINNYIKNKYEYYVISDPDIMPHPTTPPNFLEIYLNLLEAKKLHRIGFNLITSDLPKWTNEREMIIGNEAELKQNIEITWEGFNGYKAPLDTTFCLYTTKNRGWYAPMNGDDWSNCIRLFDAFHLGWYQHPEIINDEMRHYFETSKYRIPGEPSAGKNNNRPKQYQ